MSALEGEITIPLEEFWQFVEKYNPTRGSGMEVRYGVPRVDQSSSDLVIDFAAGDESPDSWGIVPKAVNQWIILKMGKS